MDDKDKKDYKKDIYNELESFMPWGILMLVAFGVIVLLCTI